MVRQSSPVLSTVQPILASRLAMSFLLPASPGDLPRIQEMASIPALDPRVAAFTLLLAISTGVVFGLFPAM